MRRRPTLLLLLVGLVVGLLGVLPGTASASGKATFNAGTGDSTNVDWATLVLQDGGWPVSTNNLTVMTDWMSSEEPPDDWWDRDNPLNNGYGSGGGSGLGSYLDLATAAYYVAANLDFGNYGYGAITTDLAASDPPAKTAKAIWASSWATSHYGTPAGSNWYTGTAPAVAAPFAAWADNGEILQVAGQSGYEEVVGGALLSVTAADLSAVQAAGPKPAPAPVEVSVAEAAMFAVVPASGTLIVSAETGHHFVVAGGAPMYLPNCGLFDGCAGAVTVDQWDLANLGEASSSSDGLLPTPANGTVVTDQQTGVTYVIAGGAPVVVSTLSDLNGSPAAGATAVAVDNWDIANAGFRGLSPADVLARVPAADTLLEGWPSQAMYEVNATGEAVYIGPGVAPGSSSGSAGAADPVVVDQDALNEAGTGGQFDHLVNAAPVASFSPSSVTTKAATVVVHYPWPVAASEVTAVSVRYRVSNPGKKFGPWLMPATYRLTGAPDVTYTPLGVGQTVCFELRATDVLEVDSAWAGDRCWTRQ